MNHPQALGPNALRTATRMADIEPFHVVVLIARAQQLEAAGRSIVNMVVGEPDAPVADPIARRYHARYGVDVPASRIGVMPESSSTWACGIESTMPWTGSGIAKW